MKKERAAGLSVLSMLAGLLAWNAVILVRDCDQLRPWGPGDEAPDFQLARVDLPGTGSLAEQRGKVVLIDFWATWCGPCLKSMPALQRLFDKHKAAGFIVMSINVEGPNAAAKAQAFAAKFEPPLTFPLYADDGRASSAYRVDVIPHMVVVDKHGRVRDVHIGGLSGGTEAKLDQLITTLVGESP